MLLFGRARLLAKTISRPSGDHAGVSSLHLRPERTVWEAGDPQLAATKSTATVTPRHDVAAAIRLIGCRRAFSNCTSLAPR